MLPVSCIFPGSAHFSKYTIFCANCKILSGSFLFLVYLRNHVHARFQLHRIPRCKVVTNYLACVLLMDCKVVSKRLLLQCYS